MSFRKAIITVAACCLYLTSADECVSSCKDLPDGDYQSCNGCSAHVTCVKGVLFDNRPCFGGYLWDDSFKRCLPASETCTETYKCVSSCAGKPDGDYHSCNGCNVYATCLAGFLIDNRPCAGNLVFNAKTKSCGFTSPTCSQ